MRARWLTILLLGLIIALTRPTPTHACSPLPLTLPDLVAQSDLIVEGTVVSHFSDQHGAELQVAHVYKGEAAERITITPVEQAQRDALGNEMMTSCYDSQAAFAESEEVILFLQPDPAGDGWRTVGLFQGKVGHQGETLLAPYLNFAQPEELAALPHRWDLLQSYLAEEVGEPREPGPLPTPPSSSGVPPWALFFGAAALVALLAFAWEPLRHFAQRRRAIPPDKIG